MAFAPTPPVYSTPFIADEKAPPINPFLSALHAPAQIAVAVDEEIHLPYVSNHQHVAVLLLVIADRLWHIEERERLIYAWKHRTERAEKCARDVFFSLYPGADTADLGCLDAGRDMLGYVRIGKAVDGRIIPGAIERSIAGRDLPARFGDFRLRGQRKMAERHPLKHGISSIAILLP